MSKETLLPHKVDPFRFAENQISLEGVIPIKDMERLRPSLFADAGQVMASMVFGVDEQGTHFVRGRYNTHLTLQCQRCMESFEYEVSGDLLLGIVSQEDEIDNLPKDYDATISQDGSLIIRDVIEDELILSLPIVPMHDPGRCKLTLPLEIGSGEFAGADQESPFKVIELLRVKRNDDK